MRRGGTVYIIVGGGDALQNCFCVVDPVRHDLPMPLGVNLIVAPPAAFLRYGVKNVFVHRIPNYSVRLKSKEGAGSQPFIWVFACVVVESNIKRRVAVQLLR